MSGKQRTLLLYGGGAAVALGVAYWFYQSGQGAERGTRQALQTIGDKVGSATGDVERIGGLALVGAMVGWLAAAVAAPETGGASLFVALGATAGAGVGAVTGSGASTDGSGSTYGLSTVDDYVPTVLGS